MIQICKFNRAKHKNNYIIANPIQYNSSRASSISSNYDFHIKIFNLNPYHPNKLINFVEQLM